MSSSAHTSADKKRHPSTLRGFILYSLGFILGKFWRFSIWLLRAIAKGFLRVTDPAPRRPVSQVKPCPVKPVPSEPKRAQKQEQPPVTLLQPDESPSGQSSKSLFTQPPIKTKLDLGDIPFGSEKSNHTFIPPHSH